MQVEQKYFSVKQAATYMGISTKMLYEWSIEGKFPAHKVGRLWRFDRDEIDKFIKESYNTDEKTCRGIERKGGLQ